VKRSALYSSSFEFKAPEGVAVFAGSPYTGQAMTVSVVARSEESPEDAAAKLLEFVGLLLAAVKAE